MSCPTHLDLVCPNRAAALGRCHDAEQVDGLAGAARLHSRKRHTREAGVHPAQCAPEELRAQQVEVYTRLGNGGLPRSNVAADEPGLDGLHPPTNVHLSSIAAFARLGLA